MSKEPRVILLADKDIAVRRSATSVLKATGYDVVTATDFDQACDAAEKKNIDLAMVGLKLGDGPTGFVLLRELKARGKAFPVIILVGTGESEDILAAFRLGAADVLLKPLRPSELLCIVDREMGLTALEAASRSGLNPSVTGENPLSKSRSELSPVEAD
ncbi:MAG: response regulator [Proteobacteria bacterium]|nr:response regulator [Pseudomonadota bacterium]